MAEIKSGQADTFVERPDKEFRTFLFYGPDSGLVSERADAISGKFGVDLSDPFSVVRMDADHAAADRARISDEAHTIGMFGGQRLIRISGSTRRNMADAIRPILESPPQDCWIVIEAGDLKKEAALRRAVERSRSAVAIPCYPDDERALDRLISAELQAAGMTIDPQARESLRANLGSDRRASRNEISKLILYCLGKKSVSAADVEAIVGDVASVEADDMINAAISGDIRRLEELLARSDRADLPADVLLLQALRLFQSIQLMRHRMDSARIPAAAAVQAHRPPLLYKRRELLERNLRYWTGELVSRILVRLDQASWEARANSALAWPIAGRMLLAIALECRRQSRSPS